MVSNRPARFSCCVRIARNEKKQLKAKNMHAIPANSSKCVLRLILEIFNEVIITSENPRRLLEALRIWVDFFSIAYKFIPR
ncbi:hypothetical protein CHA01nite_11090 [Chryseobacterium hagamense]|uniref:Uncharacterized protein n=1 Tax=Chryseobacterium hagamense TaxID=395935 RepID=A0A511YJI7_9FLAO|nr:hypothetical protein CHA01nite_11090 [Chryseobacterium hagamense]